MIQSALWLPLFDELADPVAIARIASEAEEAGWHGVFVWDHLRWREPVQEAADPWITLAAIASATERVRIGTMVTPLPRRRPAHVARETVTLDRLSGGRLTLGVGIGSDIFAEEFSRTGEPLNARIRAHMLDESLEILAAAWSGDPVTHHGEHFTVDGIRFLPRPVQRPAIPVWVAGTPGKINPLKRAARCDGFFPINLESPDQVTDIIATISTLREDPTRPFDITVGLPLGSDVAAHEVAGATWWLPEFDPETVSLNQVRGVLRDGPYR